MRLKVRKPSVFALHTSHLSPLTSGPRTWAQRVGTKNRSSALDLKSPLERGGGMFLPTGCVVLKIGGEWSVESC
ncbi:MAG: hypothetical protein XD94_1855 [Mesotoga prima]|uniref:Uncharacterized protein n=1 Tax=Mesotoga prima TaxID=1184387 RepID=A0A117M0S2_9BACT|nr:MAG: hypothetical protein XD94_1855 [Mesotoga prima]